MAQGAEVDPELPMTKAAELVFRELALALVPKPIQHHWARREGRAALAQPATSTTTTAAAAACGRR